MEHEEGQPRTNNLHIIKNYTLIKANSVCFNNTISWVVMLSTLIKVHGRFGETYHHQLQQETSRDLRFTCRFLVSCLAYKWRQYVPPKFPWTSTKQLTLHYSPQTRTLHSHRCENSKPNSVFLLNFTALYFVHKPLVYSNEYCGLSLTNSNYQSSLVPRPSLTSSSSAPELTFLWPAVGWTDRRNHRITRELIMKLRRRALKWHAAGEIKPCGHAVPSPPHT
jgi:hypothetical protein